VPFAGAVGQVLWTGAGHPCSNRVRIQVECVTDTSPRHDLVRSMVLLLLLLLALFAAADAEAMSLLRL